MMGDTPSNYNIPNGRLDGKSLGLKAMLTQTKQQLQAQNSRAYGMQNSLPPKNNNMAPKGRMGPQYTQRKHQDEERKFVNDLYRNNGANGQSSDGGTG